MELLHQLKELLNPEYLIAYGGLAICIAIVFAETGLMVGFFLPGDSLLFTAGLLCATGQFPVHILLLVSTLTIAAIVGDQVGYLTGRKFGPALFRRNESWLFKPQYIERTRAFYERHGGKTIILGRFVPIVRTFAPIIAGVAKFEYSLFVRYNIAGGILWVFSMTFAGYFLGVLVPGIKNYIEYIVIGIILLSVVPIVTTALKERARAKRSATEVERIGKAAADTAALQDNDPSNDPTSLPGSY